MDKYGRYLVDINYVAIGKRIKQRRKEKKITQEWLAELIDVSIPHMSGIENGRTMFSFPCVVRIANALEMSLDELICGSLNQGKPVMEQDFAKLLSDCSTDEAMVLLSMAKTLKKSLREFERKLEAEHEFR